KETTKKRGNHKGLPLRAVRRGNPLWLPFAVKYLFICASVLNVLLINDFKSSSITLTKNALWQ
ncbi:MAG: hypothetical protein DRR00_33860, partial [Candidatus Parabeggiatoa sp. nov. 3]